MSAADHMVWQAELDRLNADKNLRANQACGELIAGGLAEAISYAEEWTALKEQIEAHMATPPNRGPA